MLRLILFLLVFLTLTKSSTGQSKPPTFVADYYNLLRINLDSAAVFCEAQIKSGNNAQVAFGYAGSAYIATLKSEFEMADRLFQNAEELLDRRKEDQFPEYEGHIYLLKALRLIESHELQSAITLLTTITRGCNGNCSSRLTYNVRASLGRAYSLSRQHFNAIQISYEALEDFRQFLESSADRSMKINYANELIKLANYFFNVFLEDPQQYRTYLDSSLYTTSIADDYLQEHELDLLKKQILVKYGDINLLGYKHYEKAKQYYSQALPLYEGNRYKKRVEQILYRIAECHFELGEYLQTEEILNRQIEEQIWQEYQLLEFDAMSYFYLFKINAELGNAENAIKYSELYGDKIGKYYKVKNESDLKVNDLYHLETKEQEIKVYVDNYHQQRDQKHLFARLSLLLVVVVVLTIVLYIRSNKQKQKNIQELNQRIAALQQAIDKTSTTRGSSLTDKEARVLLTKLHELESQELYLREDYSLNLVAQKLSTNTSYLSKTVNTYLEVSFAEYSNRLKVNGIVNKLKEHRHYRNYTIDALAQEAGYKSVNAFNTNFKKLLKVTPSRYLKELDKVSTQSPACPSSGGGSSESMGFGSGNITH